MEKIKKNGGPYPKHEQEIRREKVFQMHFEQGYSAVKIAELLGVHRNTITSDLQSWYEELAQDRTNSNSNWLGKQLLRLESQRTRLQEFLVDGLNLKDRLQLEKAIHQIDLSISSIIVKVETSRKFMRI